MATTEEGVRENKHVILEFFSGIGGMRYAAETWAALGTTRENRNVEVAEAFEVSDVANKVYAHNFKDSPCTRSIEHLDQKLLDSFKADTWLMSPPCQPYTSMGKKKDSKDPRARALLHLCEILPKLTHPPSYILLENVNNFQNSDSRDLWMAALKSTGYIAHEFLLSPSQLDIPNERLRYYCLARREGKEAWDAALCDQMLRYVPGVATVRAGAADEEEEDAGDGGGEEGDVRRDAEAVGTGPGDGAEVGGGAGEGEGAGAGGEGKPRGLVYVDLNKTRAVHYQHCRPISDYLDDPATVDASPYMVADEDLCKWKGYVFDIVTPDSRRCSCFTKSYNKYIRGTGSLLSSNFYDANGKCLLDLEDPWCVQDLESMRKLKLRYFSETEVGRLMGFPMDRFSFPPLDTLGSRAGYRLLGNSLNVQVVAALLEHLFRQQAAESQNAQQCPAAVPEPSGSAAE